MGRIATITGGVSALAGAAYAVVFLFQQMGQPGPTPATTPSPAPPVVSSKAPDFVAVAVDWNGPCDVDTGCPVKATFRNDGGPGNGSATFTVRERSTNRLLGSCTDKIESAVAGGSANAACTVVSGDLSDWQRRYTYYHGGGSLPLTLHVEVN